MIMDSLWKLQELCCKEVDKLMQRGELSSSTLQQAAILVDVIKDVYTISAMQKGTYVLDDASCVSHVEKDERHEHIVEQQTHTNVHDETKDVLQRLVNMASMAKDPIEVAAYQRAIEQLKMA